MGHGKERLSTNFNGHLVQLVAKPGNSSYLCWESPRFPQILTFTYETNPCYVIKFLDLSFLYFHERNRLWSKRRLLVYNLHPLKITEPVFVAPLLKPPCSRFDPRDETTSPALWLAILYYTIVNTADLFYVGITMM